MEKLTNEFKIEFTKGDTYALAIKFKNITEDLRLAYFSVKDNPDDAPLIQKSLGAGITKIDDRGYKNEKTYKFQLQPADTVNLEAQVQYLYDIQVTVGNVVKTVLHGVFLLRNTITGTSAVTTQNLEVEVDDEVETEMLDTVSATNGVEYEQDPVACAKIGDLTALTTTSKGTVVQAVNEVKNGVNSNLDKLTKIENGTNKMPYAKDVTEKIDGVLLGEIFETNKKTVKNATNATNSTNATNAEKVTSKIGEKALSEIFESDGTTVKKASYANDALSCENAVTAQWLKAQNYETNKITKTGVYAVTCYWCVSDAYKYLSTHILAIFDLDQDVSSTPIPHGCALEYNSYSKTIGVMAGSNYQTYDIRNIVKILELDI